ncbi:gephyrin-like molybdotransferase Glp [Paraburkholderia sp. FT54]|uniref:molybdopterin molybdotransferase MoeA n=1 Tax=Paraburkholderia sp. FT54 TaxID=3074437 RepID=UPI0038F79875
MLRFDDAQQMLALGAPQIDTTEQVPLGDCANRVLAEPVFAAIDLPSADNSAMDGYAIRYADLSDGKPLPVQERCYAGEMPQHLAPGKATRVFTGSLIPEGADTVVMQEYAKERSNGVEFTCAPRRGQHVRRRGESIRQGQLLLEKGALLQSAHIGLIATQGIYQVSVYRQLRVGILTTGDELISPGNIHTPEKVFDSNGPMLSSLVQSMGAQVVGLIHSRDSEFEIRGALGRLLSESDLVVCAGGVSVGEKDLIKPALESMGAELAAWKVRMKPGKPVAVAYVAGKPVVCLPGNPGAVFSVFALLVTPMLRRMQGRDTLFPQVPRLPLYASREETQDRDDFIRVKCSMSDEGQLRLVPLQQQGAGELSSMARTSGLARIRAGSQFTSGQRAEYYDFQYWLT